MVYKAEMIYEDVKKATLHILILSNAIGGQSSGPFPSLLCDVIYRP